VRELAKKAHMSGFAVNVKTVDKITMLAEMTQDYTQTLANLATASTEDRLAFNTLIKTNASITVQLLLASNKET